MQTGREVVHFSTDAVLFVLQLVYVIVDNRGYTAGTAILVRRPLRPISWSGEL